MKRVLALGTMLILVLAFQNCGRQGLKADGSSSAVSVTLPQSGSGSSSVARAGTAATVTYVEIPNVSGASSGQFKVSEDISENRLVISLQSGKIQLMDAANKVLEERCLPAAELGELKTILADSKICEAPAPSSEVMCAMRMKMAYASLYANQQRVNLGEEFDSCGRGRKDLCGDLSTVFKSFVSHVKANWADMSCE